MSSFRNQQGFGVAFKKKMKTIVNYIKDIGTAIENNFSGENKKIQKGHRNDSRTRLPVKWIVDKIHITPSHNENIVEK